MFKNGKTPSIDVFARAGLVIIPSGACFDFVSGRSHPKNAG